MTPDLMTVKWADNISNWSPDAGYKNDYQLYEYPVRMFNARQGLAFHVILTINTKDVDPICSGLFQGFKVVSFKFVWFHK